MAYDLTPLKAPRASGARLKALAAFAESPAAGTALVRQLLGQVGVTALREAAADDAPWLTPPAGAATAAAARTCAPQPPANSTLGAAVPHLPGPPAGFAFETIADFTAAFAAGRTTPAAVAERVLAASGAHDAHDPPLRIFIAQDAADVRAQAEAATRRWQAGSPCGPLDGVPVAIKDELDQTPYPTTVGTRFLGREPATADAQAVARLRAAGAVLIGKTNMHEIGIGVTGINPHHGAARNPYDPARITGGSSSGVAAAVAAGLCPVALGADGGGSIRIPAALCGVVGLKPTFGRVSERGAAPLCWSLAHVGPIGATVRDVALAYALIAGPDPSEPQTLTQPAPELDRLGDGALGGITLGVYRPWFEDASPDIVAACQAGVDALVAAGAAVREVDLPELGLLRIVHLVTIVSEMAAAHLLHYAHGGRRAYGGDTRLNLRLARELRATDYVHAQRHRVRLTAHFERALQAVDVLVTPTTGCTAVPIPAAACKTGESNVALTDRIMRFAPAGNLTGLPALSVPVGYDAAGLPIGLQIMGRRFAESTLLRLGAVVEAAVARRAPRVHAPLLPSAPP